MEVAQKHGAENARIKEILQQYRDVSNASISGPIKLDKNAYQVDGDRRHRADVTSSMCARTITPYVVKLPPKEHNRLKFKETLMDGVSLVCFSFGGEKRLCLNELVGKVFKDFSPQEISILRDRLQIHCPTCTPHQMESLKIAGVLPWTCSVANLISKSDAFRLLGSLTSSRVPRRANCGFSVDSLEVYHECFGGCIGTLEIEQYSDPYSNCITCSQCDRLFSPRTFVTHNHSGERNTCHWGFDSSKWRFYLMLCNEHPTLRMQKLWEMLTNKTLNSSKRKLEPDKSTVVMDGESAKKLRTVAVNSGETALKSDKDKAIEIPGNGGRKSAFRPWAPSPTRTKVDENRSEHCGSPRHPIPIPARLFAPHTIPFIGGDFAPCPVVFSAKASSELGSPPTGDVPVTSRMGVISNTPSTKDPHSLEKTAREMVEVARNEKWETMPKQSAGNLQTAPRQITKFFEESIYRSLMNCGDLRSHLLPSAATLSSSIAQDVGELLLRQEGRIGDLAVENDKVQKELESLKEKHARTMEEAYDELRSAQSNLRSLESRHREEGEKLNNTITQLRQEVKAMDLERSERQSNGKEHELISSLKQELEEKSRNLKDKEGYCYELQHELRTLQAWIENHCRQVTAKHDGLKNSDSLIRTLYLVNGNTANSKYPKNSKENEASPRSVESMEEGRPQLQVA